MELADGVAAVSQTPLLWCHGDADPTVVVRPLNILQPPRTRFLSTRPAFTDYLGAPFCRRHARRRASRCWVGWACL